jgi:hypothetical protein
MKLKTLEHFSSLLVRTSCDDVVRSTAHELDLTFLPLMVYYWDEHTKEDEFLGNARGK